MLRLDLKRVKRQSFCEDVLMLKEHARHESDQPKLFHGQNEYQVQHV